MAINRINITIPGSSASAAGQRDEEILMLQNAGITFHFYKYLDTRSGYGIWTYYAYGYGFVDGIFTVATVTCSGMAIVPSGTNQIPMADPGAGAYTWNAIGAPNRIITSGDNNVGAAPAQNNNLWTWKIAANSPTAAADFTHAINTFQLLVGAGNWFYYRYLDTSGNGAWAVYAMAGWFAASGSAPIYFLVTCSSTPNQPSGSPMPSVAIPAFTQSFTAIGCPLNFGPGR